MADKKISELPVASAVGATDVSVLVSDGTDYQFTFSQLVQFLSANLQTGDNYSYGTTIPQNTSGKDGDVFLKTNTATFYQKINGTWTLSYTIPTGSGPDGTLCYGLGAPGPTIGANNDSYIDTSTGIFYLKTAGTWAQVFSMATGPAGAQGVPGTNGTNGTNGNTILHGTTNPSNTTDGVDGDFYLNLSTYLFFGPKAGGVWPAGESIIGADGQGVASGGTTGQVLAKIDDTDFNTQWVDAPDAPDGIITGLGITIAALSVTIAAGTWRIANTEYSTGAPVVLTLTTADPVNNRIDLIYADNTGAILALTGTASANPVEPSLPDNCIEVGFALVTPTGTSVDPAPPTNYITKATFNNTVGKKVNLTTNAKNNLVAAINELQADYTSLQTTKVDKITGYQLSQESYSTTEKTKLASLSEHYKGTYTSSSALSTANPTGNPGDYAFVDTGTGADAKMYIWDNNDTHWVLSSGTGTIAAATETSAGISALATLTQALAGTNDTNAMTALKTLSVILDQKKNVNYQIAPVSLNEVSFLMLNAGNINGITISGATNAKLKTGITGTYPTGTQTFPYAYAAGDRVFVTYNYTDLNNASCNIILTCRDN